jgi:hypothetical protein
MKKFLESFFLMILLSGTAIAYEDYYQSNEIFDPLDPINLSPARFCEIKGKTDCNGLWSEDEYASWQSDRTGKTTRDNINFRQGECLSKGGTLMTEC